MRIINWNIRGLNDLNKCDKVKKILKDFNIDIALFQESKIENPNFRFFRRLGGFYIRHWVSLPAIGTSGGLLIGWRDNSFKLLRTINRRHSLHIILIKLSDNSIIYISNVYGPNSKIGHRVLWSECLDFRKFAPGQ